MNRFTFPALLVGLSATSPLLAHPGHEIVPAATHWISDLSHLAVIGLIAALVIVVGGVALKGRIARRKQE